MNNECKTFENKSTTKNHQIQNNRIEYKIFELKHESTKLSNIWKYKYATLVLEVFASTCLY